MPWHVEKRARQWCVIKDADGENEGCHDSEAKARAQMRALYAAESRQGGQFMKPEVMSWPHQMAQAKLEAHRLVGYASVFDYPIDSGTKSFPQKTFVRPGFFTRTLEKNRDMIAVMVNHGQDPAVGMLPIGKPDVMEQDKTGLWTETTLASTRFNEETLIPLLESGALRAMSIQFLSEQESYNDDRTERYLEQGRLYEFGPVTIPANEATSATLQSLELFSRMAVEMHWDGDAAMRTCHTAGDFRQIAFERANDADPDTAAHWTLPHHTRPGAGPDSAGVAAALAALHGGRGGAPDLKQSVASVEAHLQRHQGESSSAVDPSIEAARARLASHDTFDEGMVNRWEALGS